MNHFERWDDWEWERAMQEVGKERGRGESAQHYHGQSRRYRNTAKPSWKNILKHWNGSQKRSILAAILFLLVFFSANSVDPFSKTIHSVYQSAMNSGNFYASLNGMAKDALSIGGISNKRVAVDAKMQGQLLPPISGQVVIGFGEVGKGGSNEAGSINNGIDVESALGTPVVSPTDGVVTLVGVDPQLGKVVKVEFGDGWTIVLGNLGDISVQEGQKIERGKVLGTVGLSAPQKKTWLHFELRKNNQPIDPLPYLISPKQRSEIRWRKSDFVAFDVGFHDTASGPIVACHKGSNKEDEKWSS